MRILIVEDDEAIRMTLEHLLMGENYDIYSAADGNHALQILEQLPLPNLIITDLGMHPLDGRGFVACLQQRPALNKIPVIVITAEKDIRDITGVMAIIEKPFNTDSLLAMVKVTLCP